MNVLDIQIPAIRHIKEDIPLVVDEAIKRMNYTFGKFVQGIDEEALNILVNYKWPGNVREIMNCIEKTFNIIEACTIIRKEHLPRNISEKFNINENNDDGLDELLGEYEKKIIELSLKINNGIKIKTAKKLKISTTTLWRKMKQYNMDQL